MGTNRITGERLEFIRVDAQWWGTIAPFPSGRYSGSDEVYLDLGTPAEYVRALYLRELHIHPDGGFATPVSGVWPIDPWDLATRDYVDQAVTQITLSGLLDVASGPWTSGTYVSWDGSQYVPAVPSGIGGGSGPHSLTDAATHTDVTIGTLTSGDLLQWNGTAWVNTQISGRYEETFTATGVHTVNHNLGAYPQVTVLDVTNEELGVVVDHSSINTLQLQFNGTITNGLVYCDIGTGLGGGAGTPVSPSTGGPARYSSLPPITSGVSEIIVLEGPPDTLYVSVQFSDTTWDWMEMNKAT